MKQKFAALSKYDYTLNHVDNENDVFYIKAWNIRTNFVYFNLKKDLDCDRFVDPNILGAARLAHSDLRIYRTHVQMYTCTDVHMYIIMYLLLLFMILSARFTVCPIPFNEWHVFVLSTLPWHPSCMITNPSAVRLSVVADVGAEPLQRGDRL